MAKTLDLKQRKENFERIMELKNNYGWTLNKTVNFLIRLGIEVYYLDDEVMDKI